MKNKNFITFTMIFSIVFIFLESIAVDAYIPVTYTCCNDFSNSRGDQLDDIEHINEISGIQLDNFENLSNWTMGLGTQYADTINYKEGNQSLGLISSNGNRAYSNRVINNNFLNRNNFSIWVYVYNASTFYYPRIYLTSTGNQWSKYFYGSYYNGMYNGWNKLILSKDSFVNYNNESWNNAMNMIRIAMYPNTNLNTNVSVDDLRYNYSNEWTVGGNGAYQEPDRVNFKQGSEGLKLIATNGNRAYSDKIIDNDFSNTNNFVIWLYVYNATSFDFLRIYLTSVGNSWNRYFQANIYSEPPGYKTGWNKLVFDKNSFLSFYNESWNNRMNRMRIAIYPKVDQNTNASIDDLRTNLNGKRGKIIITFDDGDKNVSTKALPILNANNQSGVSFAITSWIGNTGYMNISDLKNLQSNGWDISSHSVDHPHLTDLDSSNLTTELNNSYDWLVNNNFQKSAGFMAYPYGTFNDNVINYVKKRYIFGRSTSQQPINPHFDPTDDAELYIQRVIYVLNTTSVQAVKAKIDDVINNKLLGVLLFHDIVDPNYTFGSDPANDPYRYKTSDFQNISDYLKSNSNDIDVVTYSDYIIPNINSFTPVINKTTRIYSNGTSVLITNNKYDEYMPNMTVIPLSGSIDIGITQYNETNGYIKFNESSSNNDLQVSYAIGDRIPNQLYSVKIYWANGTKYQDFSLLANSTGHINYNSTGFEDSRYQEIMAAGMVDSTFTVTLPIWYTFLRFNATNSTITNLDPEGQNSSMPTFNITNNGNIIQSYRFYLNNTISNITTYADLDNNHTTGRIEINATPSIIVPNLNPGSSQNIWMIIDTNKALATNVTRTLMINNSN